MVAFRGSYRMIQPGGSCKRVNEPSPFCMLPGISQISSISSKLMGASCAGFTNCTSWSKSSARSQPEPCPFKGLPSIFSQAVRTAILIVAARDGFARLALPIDPKALLLLCLPKPVHLSAEKRLSKRDSPYQVDSTKVADLTLADLRTASAELTKYSRSHFASHEEGCLILWLYCRWSAVIRRLT